MKSWNDLTPAQQADFGNGVGPWWFPSWPRKILTKIAEVFFQEADWGRHDFGYKFETAPRWICDLRFLQAMLRDASQIDHQLKIFGAVLLSTFFWIMVRLFGWASYGASQWRISKWIKSVFGKS